MSAMSASCRCSPNTLQTQPFQEVELDESSCSTELNDTIGTITSWAAFTTDDEADDEGQHSSGDSKARWHITSTSNIHTGLTRHLAVDHHPQVLCEDANNKERALDGCSDSSDTEEPVGNVCEWTTDDEFDGASSLRKTQATPPSTPHPSGSAPRWELISPPLGPRTCRHMEMASGEPRLLAALTNDSIDEAHWQVAKLSNMLPPFPAAPETKANTVSLFSDQANVDELLQGKGRCKGRCERILELLMDPAWKDPVAKELSEKFPTMACTPCGTRVAQKFYEAVGDHYRQNALTSLRGKVEKLSKSRHGNFVVQMVAKKFEELPSSIKEEILKCAMALPKHKFVSRIVERLLEHWPLDVIIDPLVEMLFKQVLPLALDEYGNYVVKSLLKNLGEPWRDRFVKEVVGNLAILANDSYGIHVVLEAWLRTDAHRRRELVDEFLLCENPTLADIACSKFGACMLKEISKVSGNICEPLIGRLRGDAQLLCSNEHGRSVIEYFGLMPR